MQIDSATRRAMEEIINQRIKVKAMTDSNKEMVKALAERLDVKPAQISKIISLIEKERDKGDVIVEERAILDNAEAYLVG